MVKSMLKRMKVHSNVFFLAEACPLVLDPPYHAACMFVPLEASMKGSAEESNGNQVNTM